MAILSRIKVSPQQRFDLEDLQAMQSAARTDAKLWTKSLLSAENLIYGGFAVSGLGLNEATIAMTGAALIVPENTTDFSYFISSPTESDITISDADLTDGVRNYVELSLATLDGTPLTKAFWDPEADSGAGAEFNQIVNTVTDLRVSVTVSTGGFSGSADSLPLAIIDTDGGGIIKVILDRRELFGRLARPNDLDNEYTWGTKEEPVYSLVMTGVSGTFTAGETINIGSETATVVTGGTTSITFNEPSGINFANGDAVSGVDSGATGTLDTVIESFSGVDKSLNTQKEINDALMTEIKLLKGTRFWWAPSVTMTALNRFMNSVITPASTTARFRWTGTDLVIEDDNAAPTGTDSIAYIRLFGRGDDLIISRQETGQEIQKIEFDEVPTSGTLTLEHNGDTSDTINWDDTAGDVQTAINAQWAAQVTVSGNFEDGFTITFDTAGPVVEHTEASNTLTGPSGAVGTTISTVKNGYAGGSTVPIADGEVLYVQVPLSGDRTWSDAGVGSTNFQVQAVADYDITDGERYWIAYREAGSVLVVRGVGELQTGESSEIGDNVPQSLLDILGLVDEVTAPAYTSNVRGTQGQSFVDRMSKNTDAIGDSQEDRSAYLRSDEVVTWTGTQLEFTSDIELRIENTKGGTPTVHTIDVGDSPIAVADGETIWVEINRLAASETLTVRNSGVDAIPAQTQDDKDVFILFKRIDANSVQVLHLPFHKQALDPGQSVRLGASGSGSGAGSDAAADYKRRLAESPFKRVSVNAFALDGSDYVDGASTGAYSPAKSAFEFTAAAQTLIDAQNLDSDFLADGIFPRKVELYLQWLAGEIDTGATYELSLNGGTIWEAISMERVEDTNAYRGILELADPTDDDLQEVDVALADSVYVLNDGTTEARAQSFDVTNTQNVREIEVYLNKLGSPTGNLTVKIVKDDSNAPSTADTDVVASSDVIDIENDLSAGDNAITADVNDSVLVAGTYWIVFETDATYKSSFSTGVDEIRVRADSSSPALADAQVFNGTIWAAVAGSNLCFLVKGIELDLRVRVTASAAGSIQSYGVFYDRTPGVTAAGDKKVDRFTFSGDENRTEFSLSFTPHPDFLEILDITQGQVYTVDNDRIRINSSTVEFDADFFDFPGETIKLMFRQTDSAIIDESAQNGNKIASIEAQLVDIGDELASISDSMILPRIPAPNTTVLGRAQMVDLENDLKVHLGPERIEVNDLYLLDDEKGPDQEVVYGAQNDGFGQLRFVGDWDREVGVNGAIVSTPANSSGFVEITFFGTALTLLTLANSSNYDARASVDGGIEGSNLFLTSYDGELVNRNYNPNMGLPVVSGLSLGIHTVKIRQASASEPLFISGFEVVKEESSGNVVVNPGSQLHKGKKRTLAVQTNLSHNSGFETGSLGTKGGHVLVYQKVDGSVAHAVNPTDVTQLNFGAANHANEKISRRYNFRKFGAGRTDDWNINFNSTDDVHFALNDAVNNMFANDLGGNSAFPNTVFHNGASNPYHTITFIGTGLDLLMSRRGTGQTTDVRIDGVSIGNMPAGPTVLDNEFYIQPIVSGLPYGTHTVTFHRTGADAGPSNAFFYMDHIVYVPDAPSMPADAVALAEYFVMADFAAIAAVGNERVATGVLRKHVASREMAIIQGTGGSFDWIGTTVVANTGSDAVGGFRTETDRQNAEFRYQFWGTGFDYRFFADSNRSASITVELNGLTADTTNYPTLTAAAVGSGISYNTGTGVMDAQGSGSEEGASIRVEGLPLAYYEVVFRNNNASQRLTMETFDVICPMHAPKLIGPIAMQNVVESGPAAINDLRRFSRKDIPRVPRMVKIAGVNSSPTLTFTTPQPAPDMNAAIWTTGKPIKIESHITTSHNLSGGNAVSYEIYVDNVLVSRPNLMTHSSSGASTRNAEMVIVPVKAGLHQVTVLAFTNGGTLTFTDVRRNITISEVGTED